MLPRRFKDFEFRLGKLGITVFVIGFSLLILLAFVFGVKVGKDIDTLPGRIVNIIPAIKGKILGNQADSTENKAQISEQAKNENFKLGFYDALKKEAPEDLKKAAVESPPAQAQAPAQGKIEQQPSPERPAAPAAPEKGISPADSANGKAFASRTGC